MMDITGSPPSFSFPRITRRRRNTNNGASPSNNNTPAVAPTTPSVPLPPSAPSHLSGGAHDQTVIVPPGAAVLPTSAGPASPGPSGIFPPASAGAPAPAPAGEGEKQTYRIRLVPHLENARSLHFEPIVRDVKVGGPPLRVGRFTDRATNPSRGNGLNPNDRNSDKVAFRSKVVSRAHAELWAQGKGVFFLKDTKSSSGTFINHMRLSPPGQESAAHILKDGDIIQLGVDYQGGTEEMYRCVKIKVEVGQGREWQGGANAFNTAALKQLRTLQAVDGARNKDGLRKTVGDCCICLFAVSVCQSLFIAPCSHAFHYKCIRPLLELHHPGFSCPLCRTFADLEADVEVDENELKAIEAALDEAEEDANALPALAAVGASGHSVEDAIAVDSDVGGSPVVNRTANGTTGGAPAAAAPSRNPFLSGAAAAAAPAHSSAIDEDRQVEDELEVEFDEDDEGDEHMVSADEFGGRHHGAGGDDVHMDTTYSPDKRNAALRDLHDAATGNANGAGPSTRSKALSIGARRTAADAEREETELANAATPLNNTFMTTNNLLAMAGSSRPFSATLEAELDEHDHGGWTENEGGHHGATTAGRAAGGSGSSSGSNPGSGTNSPSMMNSTAAVNGNATAAIATTGAGSTATGARGGLSAGAAATGLGSGGPKTRTPTHSQERPRPTAATNAAATASADVNSD